MVRILCLHGSGSSGDIFESQTSTLRALLPRHWEWCFYNAEIECGPLPQLEGLYPGPFYTAVALPSLKMIQRVHAWIREIIEEDGPFDGLLGFSAGGYVPISLMLHHQKYNPTSAPPFRFLVLMGGNLPYSADPNEGIEVTDWISFHRMPPADLSVIKAFNTWAPHHQDQRPGVRDLTGINPILHCIVDDWVGTEYNRELLVTYLYHPDATKTRVKVPTLHILGRQDDVYEGGKKLMELCEKRNRMEYHFDGGHEIPRNRADLVKIAGMFEKVVQSSLMLS
ncbi:Dihydrofolate reductase [Sphaceloma murrayae]|uniref:Dihydrofolate reductase n=1 Tax=Sphaceloma murrayae TaxID=2082308 RepID=A0A2K1QHX7_9PEZI|nr:Dihydrofolate reductase [Sphaceloma murrayae]